MNPADRASFAEGLVKRGWFIFPCRPNEKQPATRSGLDAATDDLVTVRRWWTQRDYNIGINAGLSNLLILDLDIKPERGAPGISWWLEKCETYGYPFETYTYMVITPKSGLHVYFSTNTKYPPSVSKLAPNVDVRAGRSYVVGVGSVVDDGYYAWVGSNVVAPLPQWLGLLCEPTPPPQDRQTARNLVRDASGRDYNAAVLGLAGAVLEALEGERNNTFNWACWKVTQHLWTDAQKDDAYEAIKRAGVANGLTEKECDDTIKSSRGGN